MSEELTPITRIEEYLDGIVNGGAIPLEPVTRVEQFLDAIANSQTCALTPVTRIEAYLGKISGQSLTLPDPVTRVEQYLAKIAGEDVAIPDEPVTRIEEWLAEWANGGSPSYETVTGSIASFVTLRAAPLKELVVDIEPVQSGSGGPSPDNVRPISGWTGAKIWVDDTHDTSAQADYNISWQTEAGTVYGGTLTVNEDGSGVLAVDLEYGSKLLSAYDQKYSGETYDLYVFNDFVSAIPAVNNMQKCNIAPYSNTTGQSLHFYIASNKKMQIYLPHDIDLTTTVEAVCELATPITYQLTAQQVIDALQGQNYVWADTGDVSVTYYYPGTTASPIVGVGTVNNMVI